MVLPILSLSLQLHIDFLFSGREAALESFRAEGAGKVSLIGTVDIWNTTGIKLRKASIRTQLILRLFI